MRARPFALGMLLAAAVLAGELGAATSALAQSDDSIRALNRRVVDLHRTGKYAEAIPVAERLAEAVEARRGPDHPESASALNNLALLLQAANRLTEAERLMRRALAIDEKHFGPEHHTVAGDLSNLAALLRDLNRSTEAEPLMRRVLAVDEKTFGPEHPAVAGDLNNLAVLLRDSNRLAEAEPLYRRALAVEEKSSGPGHPNVAAGLNNLADLLHVTNRLAEAEPLYRRALAISEKSFGPEHPTVATASSNLAKLLGSTNRIGEAESLARRALAIDEKNFGPEHPTVAIRLNNLAQLLHAIDGLAEPLYRRALAIFERTLGPDHPNVAIGLNNLAALRAERGDWAEAARLHRRAVPIMTRAQGSLAKAALVQSTWKLRASARALYRAGGGNKDERAEGFELAQWALQTSAADALSQVAVRFAKGAGPLAGLARERQDLIARHRRQDKSLLAAVGSADTTAAESVRVAITSLDAQIAAIDKRLAAEFPDYAQLSNPAPLPIAAVQNLLEEDEALVVFLDVPRFGGLPGETLAWAVTKGEARWVGIPLGTDALAARVTQLRCGLDRDGRWAWSAQRQRWEAKGERCRVLKPDGLAYDEFLPFDLRVAHELYAALLAPFVDLITGKSLIIVPSGPLTSLPFHVLVTASPSLRATSASPRTPSAGGEEQGESQRFTPSTESAVAPHPLLASRARESPAWLALTQPITVLPSVGSLQALRKLPPSQASEPYIAFGNPLLDGGDPNGKEAASARNKQSCPQELDSPLPRAAATDRGAPGLGTPFRGGVDLALLRAQAPLPETADELCAVARSVGALGVQKREIDTIWLGARATEANLKALSRSGKLAQYRVVHFATHGVLAGESEEILKARAEPALILNPPRDGASREQLEEDDGLLSASEVAQLELDADWVVLSACNTAAGEKGDAEALSGLARAFFYAKARALLVSHWYVNSEAAVKLTTGALAELGANPKIGRAEALRRSMARLITTGRPDEAHPEYWAPFVLVGDDAK